MKTLRGGGVGTARALAKVYGILANGGDELNISPGIMAIMSNSTAPPTDGIRDEVMAGNLWVLQQDMRNLTCYLILEVSKLLDLQEVVGALLLLIRNTNAAMLTL